MASQQLYQVYANNPLTPALTDIVPFQPNDAGATEMGASTWQELCTALGIALPIKVSLSSAEILALNATPKQVVAAGGAGTVLFPVAILWKYTFGTTPYATNTTLRVRMGGTMMSLGTLLTQTGNAYALQPLLGGVFSTDISNTAITIDVQTGNPTGGDGTLDAYLIYNTISL